MKVILQLLPLKGESALVPFVLREGVEQNEFLRLLASAGEAAWDRAQANVANAPVIAAMGRNF